jgi:KDO2-lipid IV(A) lauroyltransferase
VALAHLLPRSANIALSMASSRAVYFLFPGVRAGLLANAKRILGPGSSSADRSALAQAVLASFAHFLAELVSPPQKAPRQDLGKETSGREHFDTALAAGKGVILVTLHMGNYELSGLELAQLKHNVAVVYNRERIRFLEKLRSRRRKEKRLDEIVINDSRYFGIEVLQRLRNQGIVLLAGDQVETKEGEPFPFLHGSAIFSLWPARLSLASGAPIVPAFNLREPDGSCRLYLEAPIFPSSAREPRAMMEELIRVFERYVREHADQWLMIRRFWS